MTSKVAVEFTVNTDDYHDIVTRDDIVSLVRSMLERTADLPESGKIVVNIEDMVTVHDFP